MNKEEKVALLDKLAADKDLTAYIIGCARGDLTSRDPRTVIEECFVCDHVITCFRVSAERKKKGFILLCKQCLAEIVRRRNSRGQAVRFGGRVRDNKLPEMFKDPYRLVHGLFDRIGCARGDLTSKDLTACIWYILHPTDDTLAWSGSRWVPLGGDVQVCNFLSKEAARTYADEVFHR